MTIFICSFCFVLLYAFCVLDKYVNWSETIYTPREKVGVKKFCVNDQDECGSVPFCHIHVSAQRIISANIFPSYKTVYVDKVYLFLLYLFWAGHVLACPLYYCFWPSKDLLLKQWVYMTYILSVYLCAPGGLSSVYNWPFHRSPCDLALRKTFRWQLRSDNKFISLRERN